MLGRFLERGADEFLPYAGHIDNDIVLMMDGGAMGVFHLQGSPFELEGPDVRNARAKRINTLFRTIADDNVTICTHFVRHGDHTPSPAGHFVSAFSAKLHETYQQAVLDDRLSNNVWLLTVIIAPRKLSKKVGRKQKRNLAVNSDVVRKLRDVMQTVESTLTDNRPRRLGIRDVGGVLFTEVGEALHLIRTGLWRPIPIVAGSLGASVYTERMIAGKRAFKLEVPGVDRFGSILSLREYPSMTKPGMFNELLSVRYPVVMSQSFAFMNRASALSAFTLKQNQMQASGDKALSQIDSLNEAMDQIASNEVAVGVHTFTLTVYAASLAELGKNVSDAGSKVTNAGAVTCVEEHGLEAAYWSQMPGVAAAWATRPGKVSSRNFADMSSFEGFPTGEASGYWGPALVRFRTRGGTAYDYIPHVVDVGHTLIFGKTGSGKTALLCFLMAELEQATQNTGCVVFFDKDRGGELLVRARGGRYLPLRRGAPSGMAPLRSSENTPEAAAFLHTLFSGLILQDGGRQLSPDENNRMRRGIASQLRMPPDMRRLAGVREFMDHAAEGAGARFERWCDGGTFGWVFDNAEDHVALDAPLLGFDMTELLPREEGMPDDGVCVAAATYLMYRLRALMDGRRVAVFCDECRFYMPALAQVLEDIALTGRKKDVMLVMAAQQPEHILSHRAGPSLVSQCQTKILFPNASADRESYIEGLKLTEAAFEQISGDMTIGKARNFLLWREAASVILEFDLSGLADELTILSGREKTIRLMDRVRADLRSDDPADILPEFHRRRRLLAAA